MDSDPTANIEVFCNAAADSAYSKLIDSYLNFKMVLRFNTCQHIWFFKIKVLHAKGCAGTNLSDKLIVWYSDILHLLFSYFFTDGKFTVDCRTWNISVNYRVHVLTFIKTFISNDVNIWKSLV